MSGGGFEIESLEIFWMQTFLDGINLLADNDDFMYIYTQL